MSHARRMSWVVLVGGLAGCGSGDPPGYGTQSCDFREDSANGAEGRCQERHMIVSEFFILGCKAAGGESLSGECPREGVLGGCRLEGSNPMQVATDWYYPTLADGTPADLDTREKVMDQCKDEGVFVEP